MPQVRKIHKNILPKILLCVLILALTTLTLAGCGRYGGSANPPDKATLAENARGGGSYEYIADYLDEWDFPRFDKAKITTVEDRVLSTSVIEYPEKGDHARLTAEYFLDNYYDKTNLSDPNEVTDALLRAYFSTSGDPYSRYRDPTEYAAYIEKSSGKSVGIGISFFKSGEKFTVSNVLDGSSAESAGILVGDEIVSIGGNSLSGYSTDAVYALLSGEVGSTVTLTVRRNGSEFSVDAARAVIEEKTVIFEERLVAYEKDDSTPLYLNVGYVKITAFRQNTADQFIAAIDELEALGVQGFILDLRDNGGGYLSSVVKMLDYLVPINTKIVSYKYKSAANKVERAETQHTIDKPIAVLVNQSSASAAEVFAAAVHDYASTNVLNAFLVGKTTYGKGIMQTGYTLADGSAFQITSASLLSPLGVSYHGIGIAPTIEADVGSGDDEQYGAAAAEIAKLVAIYTNGLSKEHLIELLTKNMNEDSGKEYSYVSDFLREWRIPVFDAAKLRTLQDHYSSRVGRIENVRELAKNTVLLFANKYYVNTNVTDVTSTTDSLIRAWVDALGDRWAEYRTPEEYKSFMDELDGKSVGIGITIDSQNHLITKIARSSDAHSRLLVGDTLIAVDGVELIPETDTSAGNYNLINSLITGEPDTTVDITVMRDGEVITVTVTRRADDTQTVLVEVDENGIAYIEITSFKATTEQLFKQAINSLMAQGVRGFILDLRGNIGGVLNAITSSISCLVGSGAPIMSFEFKNGASMSPLSSSGSTSIGKTPVVVLCDKYTASAGELFCAALRDYDEMGLMNVKLVGEVTVGKAILQETQRLGDGSSITLTIAHFYPPLGKDASFAGTGITPDYIESDRDAQESLAMEVILDMIEAYESASDTTPE